MWNLRGMATHGHFVASCIKWSTPIQFIISHLPPDLTLSPWHLDPSRYHECRKGRILEICQLNFHGTKLCAPANVRTRSRWTWWRLPGLQDMTHPAENKQNRGLMVAACFKGFSQNHMLKMLQAQNKIQYEEMEMTHLGPRTQKQEYAYDYMNI